MSEFQPDGVGAVTGLLRELHSGALPTETGLDFVARLLAVTRRLMSLGHPVGDEALLVATIVDGLPASYSALQHAFYGSHNAVWTLDDVRRSIRSSDMQHARSLSGSEPLGSAFLAGSLETRTCLRCHQPGHLARDCPSQRPHQPRPRDHTPQAQANYYQKLADEQRAIAKAHPAKPVAALAIAESLEYASEEEETEVSAWAADGAGAMLACQDCNFLQLDLEYASEGEEASERAQAKAGAGAYLASRAPSRIPTSALFHPQQQPQHPQQPGFVAAATTVAAAAPRQQLQQRSSNSRSLRAHAVRLYSGHPVDGDNGVQELGGHHAATPVRYPFGLLEHG